MSFDGMIVRVGRQRGESVSRVERLEQLKLMLAEREYTTATHLAEDLGVSLRTLHRDLATLRDLGVPVGGLAGRGGGVYLERGWSLGRVHLNEREAMGLLLSLAVAERTGSPLLIDDVRSIERKLVQAFAPSRMTAIRSLRKRVLLGGPASDTVLATHGRADPSMARGLLERFMSQRAARITYTDQHGTSSVRDVEAHYLFFSLPVWYVLAWDRSRDDARSFRVDRIRRLEPLTGTFKVRPTEDFIDILELAARPL